MISRKDKVLKFGLMVLSMKVSMFKGKNREKESFFGLMGRNMKGSFLIIIFMDTELIHGRMEETSRETGKITKWMEKVNLSGRVFFYFFGMY
jgi:hypothetical protein